MSLVDLLIGQRHVSSPLPMPVIYNYWWLITSLESSIGKKETHMFYVANVITFSVFSYLLCKSTLLVCYQFNRLRPPQVNQFDISALLFGGYARFILLGKMVYRYNGKHCTLAVHKCYSYLWNCFCCVMDSYCSILIIPSEYFNSVFR